MEMETGVTLVQAEDASYEESVRDLLVHVE